jgi:hypothetical protein
MQCRSQSTLVVEDASPFGKAGEVWPRRNGNIAPVSKIGG